MKTATFNTMKKDRIKMTFHRLISIITLSLLTSITLSLPASAAPKSEKPAACAGISKKCTKDALYDKTIKGKDYSCYDCSQALCKNGGTGGLAGTATSSVCTEKKATSFRPIPQDNQIQGGSNKLAPKAKQQGRPSSRFNNKLQRQAPAKPTGVIEVRPAFHPAPTTKIQTPKSAAPAK